jgi:hypothetical protein
MQAAIVQAVGDTVMFIDGDFEFYTYCQVTGYIVIASKRHPLYGTCVYTTKISKQDV